ncbi:ADP-ribose 1-phosphate phosphatase YML087W, partial [Biomphalaria pfeifferi]
MAASNVKEEGSFDGIVTYHLRDINVELVEEWQHAFSEYSDSVKISQGDIFNDAPAADAIVSPANSFGFMDGGIDWIYSKYFGWQMQNRLQNVIREDYHGELPVGQAIIIPAYDPSIQIPDIEPDYNEGVAIKYLISAPTMRVPAIVSNTVNAYLAFRAVILAVKKHNSSKTLPYIRSVLVPGLGTTVGKMPKKRCAFQMLQAYETFEKSKHKFRTHPDSLCVVDDDDYKMSS